MKDPRECLPWTPVYWDPRDEQWNLGVGDHNGRLIVQAWVEWDRELRCFWTLGIVPMSFLVV